MTQKPWYMRLWVRLIISFIAILLIVFCVGLIVWGRNSSSNDIALVLIAALSACFALGQWFFPLSSEKIGYLPLPHARELSRDSSSFRMGDRSAANFDYITEPIKNTFDSTKKALIDISVKASPKHGVLILGSANAGKSRLAFEALTQTLPNWKVLLWNVSFDALPKIPSFSLSHGSGLAIFVDDLQEYVPSDNYSADALVVVSDNRLATLQAFLNNWQATVRLLIVATCRIEDETRVGAKARWLFDQLEVIVLPSFRSQIASSELVNIIDLFQRHGATHVEDWDGTLGSLVLGLSKKRSQYEDLVQSHSYAVLILRAMKLLSLALIKVHSVTRIQEACQDVFGEPALYESSRIWQEQVDQLVRLEFVTEVRNPVTGDLALIIRKDAYFDKVITDYPAPNRPYQLSQHFDQLQKALVKLNDSAALVDLAGALGELKQYVEALVAYDQALHLDSTIARAYFGKGTTLSELKRYEEAVASYNQALSFNKDYGAIYNNKGAALSELKRYEEAIAAFDQALLLDPTYSVACNNKGITLGELGRYEEAVVAFDQALHLDSRLVDAYFNKGVALGKLEQYEEAVAAYDQASNLSPRDATIYHNKGVALSELDQDEEAVAAYDQALSLDPKYTFAYYNKGVALQELGRDEEAIDAYNQALRLDPDYTLAYYNRGNALGRLGRDEEAIDAYNQALRLDPTDALIYNNKGAALVKLGRDQEAMVVYDQALHFDPNYAFAYYNKGKLLSKLGRYEEASVVYNQALHLDPDLTLAYYNKGNALSNLKRFEEAVAAYDQALRLDPTDTRIYNNKGKALNEIKRYEEAVAAYDQALRLDPTDVFLCVNKGVALSNLKRYEEAMAAYDQALHIDPTNVYANYEREQLLRILS